MDISQQIDLIYCLPLAAAGLAVINALWSWRNRDLPGMRSLSTLLISIAIWSVVESIQYQVNGVSNKVFWSKIQYLGIAPTPVLYLFFSARYSQKDHWLTRRNTGLLWIIPTFTILMVVTNEIHHWHWHSFTLNPENNILTYHYGPWFWIFAITSYVYLIGATYLLFRFAHQLQKHYRPRLVLVILAAIIPWTANLFHVIGLIPIEGLDLTPISMILSTLLLTLSISKFNFADLTPVARHKLVDTLKDALVVVDTSGNVADINPAALSIINHSRKEVIRQHASSVLKHWPHLSNHFKGTSRETTDIAIISDRNGRYYDSRISPLYNNNQTLIGHLYTLRDISELKKMEAERLRLASVIEQAKEAIIIMELDGSIIYANPHFKETTDQVISKTPGRKPQILQRGKHNQEYYAQLWETISKGNIWTGTLTNERKDGSEYHETATIFPIKDENSQIINYAAVFRDVTSEINIREEIKRFSDRLTILHEIGIQLSDEGELNDIIRKAVLDGHNRLGFERTGIWLVDSTNPDYLLGTFGIDEHGNLRDERDQRHHKSKHPEYNYALEKKKRIYHLIDTPLYNHVAEPVGNGEMAISGFWDRDEILGYIAIDNYNSGNPLSERQCAILILYSQTLGDLLVRKRADQSLQAFTNKLSTLHKISLELSQIGSFDEMVRMAVLSACDCLGFERMEIWYVDQDDSTVIRGSFSIDEEGQLEDTHNLTRSIESSPILELRKPDSRRLYHQKNAEIYNLEDEKIGDGEIAVSALWDGSGIIGYIQVDNLFTHMRFETHQLEILTLYAQLIGSLSTRMRTTEEIRKVAREQMILSDITQSAIQQTDYQKLLQNLVDRLGELFKADGCYISLWDNDNRTFLPAAAYGLDIEKYGNEILPIDFKSPQIKTVLSAGKVLVLNDINNDIYNQNARVIPPKTSLILPLIADQVKLGLAIITYNLLHQLTSSDLDLAEKASRQIALAMLKNRLLEEAQIRATEAETLRQASAAVVTTLNQDEAIESVLEQLNRVVPYDSASVQLLEGDELRIVGERGFKDPGAVLGLRTKITQDIPTAQVFDSREPIIIEDAKLEYQVFREPPHEQIRGWMGVPLKVHEQIIGMLALNSYQPGRFNENHRRLATAFADQVAIALENTRLFKEIQWLAIHDSMTGLFNRHHFLSLANIEFERAKRYSKPLSAVMLDIDHFKQVNDTYGHIIGDQVLRYIAEICMDNLRSHDLVGRYGGEEFIILLPETAAQGTRLDQAVFSLSAEPAKIVAERLRREFEGKILETERGNFSVQVSLGVAEMTDEVFTVEQLIDYADQALLLAKKTGRNRVILWPIV